MRNQELIMQEGGYVSAVDAAEALGIESIQTIHRMVKAGKLKGARAGSRWYVSVASLLHEYRDAPPMLARIQALGVKPAKVAPARKTSGLGPIPPTPNRVASPRKAG